MAFDLDTMKAFGGYLATGFGGLFVSRILLSRDSLERRSNTASETAIKSLTEALKAAEERAEAAEKKAEHLEKRLDEQSKKLENALRRISELEQKDAAR